MELYVGSDDFLYHLHFLWHNHAFRFLALVFGEKAARRIPRTFYFLSLSVSLFNRFFGLQPSPLICMLLYIFLRFPLRYLLA
jgi:hypothetical protein